MFKSKEGYPVPNTVFRIIDGDKWKDVSSDSLFKDRRVIVFSLPGAFTPTCSSSHLPRYDELANVFKQYGIDDIIVISVNDTFVMNSWKKDQKTENITFIPDGNGTFTEGMDMLVEKDDLGFGNRSWRYSMVVNNGIVEKQFIEPEKDGDPFEVSDADTMLSYIAPDHKPQKDITIFTKSDCPHCVMAKNVLKKKGLKFEEISVSSDSSITDSTIRAISGKTSVPQIFVGGKHIGGADDLVLFLKK